MSRLTKVCLLVLLGFIILSFFTIKRVYASPTFNVTDESEYVTIENDYYIANISKSKSLIQNFYIKPYDSVDIIGHVGNVWGLGFHEIEAYEGSNGQSCWQTSSENHAYNTTIMYNDGSTVVVRSRFNLTELSPPPDLQLNITEWKIFYADKPWFVVTFTQEFLIENQFWNENQICFIYDKDYPSEYSMLDDNGTVLLNDGDNEYGHHYSSKYLQKYMWVHTANSTYETGIGHILIDSYPRSLTTRFGNWFGTEYKEWQLTLNEHSMGLPANSKQTVTYINYVAYKNTTIDNFSEQLYKQNHKVTCDQGQGFIPHVMNNYSHTECGGIGKKGSFFWNFYGSNFRSLYYTEGDAGMGARFVYAKYANASGTYNVPTAWTFPSNYWNSTYANLTVRTEFESKLRYEMTVEAWKDNDVIKTTFMFQTLATMNITDLYIDFHHWSVGGCCGWISITELSPSILILNASNTQVNWMYDYGTAFKNTTAYATRSTNTGHFYYYLLDNSSDTEYSSGQIWTLTLMIHKFIRTTDEGTYFEADDFLETGSNLRNFNHQIWTPLPFPEVPSEPTFYVKHLGSQYAQLITSTHSSDKLVLNIAGDIGETSEWQIYTPPYTPIYISNTSFNLTRDFNETSKILGINISHSSNEIITIGFRNSTSDPLLGNSVLAIDDNIKLTAVPTYNSSTKQFNLTINGTGTNKNITLNISNISTNYFRVYDNDNLVLEWKSSSGVNKVNSSYNLEYNSTTKIATITIPTMSEHNILLDGSSKSDGRSCSSNEECSGGYCVHNICRSASTYCGDGYCDSGESCFSCLLDCGICKGGFPSEEEEELPEEIPEECPVCPDPTEWSECINNQKIRTNYQCSAETNYICESYTETRDCVSKEEIKPTNILLEYWYVWLVIIVIIVIILYLRF